MTDLSQKFSLSSSIIDEARKEVYSIIKNRSKKSIEELIEGEQIDFIICHLRLAVNLFRSKSKIKLIEERKIFLFIKNLGIENHPRLSLLEDFLIFSTIFNTWIKLDLLNNNIEKINSNIKPFFEFANSNESSSFVSLTIAKTIDKSFNNNNKFYKIYLSYFLNFINYIYENIYEDSSRKLNSMGDIINAFDYLTKADEAPQNFNLINYLNEINFNFSLSRNNLKNNNQKFVQINFSKIDSSISQSGKICTISFEIKNIKNEILLMRINTPIYFIEKSEFTNNTETLGKCSLGPEENEISGRSLTKIAFSFDFDKDTTVSHCDQIFFKDGLNNSQPDGVGS